MNASTREGRPLWRCQSCGRALASAEEECAHCAADVAAHRFTGEGPHRCPSCSAWFAVPGSRREPPDAPWYRPSRTRLQCPHCGVPLRDRKRIESKPWPGLLVVAVAVASQVWAPRVLRDVLWVGCMAGFLWVMLKTRQGGVTDEHRFGPDDH